MKKISFRLIAVLFSFSLISCADYLNEKMGYTKPVELEKDNDNGGNGDNGDYGGGNDNPGDGDDSIQFYKWDWGCSYTFDLASYYNGSIDNFLKEGFKVHIQGTPNENLPVLKFKIYDSNSPYEDVVYEIAFADNLKANEPFDITFNAPISKPVTTGSRYTVELNYSSDFKSEAVKINDFNMSIQKDEIGFVFPKSEWGGINDRDYSYEHVIIGHVFDNKTISSNKYVNLQFTCISPEEFNPLRFRLVNTQGDWIDLIDWENTKIGSIVNGYNNIKVSIPIRSDISDYYELENCRIYIYYNKDTMDKEFAFSYCDIQVTISDNPQYDLYDGINKIGYTFEKGVLTINSEKAFVQYQDFWTSSGISKDSVEKIIIEEGITRIPESEFWGCTNLSEITLPSTLRTIEERAFMNCDKVEQITIPNSVTYIGTDSFGSSIIFLDWPSTDRTAREIVSDAFFARQIVIYNNKITYPDSGETIPPLYRIDGNTMTVLGTEKIQDYVFEYFSIKFPEIKTIIFAEGITCVGADAFRGCTNVTSILLPSTLEEIWANAFADNMCTEILIPNKVTRISVYAFSNMFEGPYITLDWPHDDTTQRLFSSEAFTGTGGAKYNDGYVFSFSIDRDTWTYQNDTLTILSDYAFNGMGDSYNFVAKNEELQGVYIDEIVISEGVTFIPNNAFHDMNVTSISLPSTLYNVGSNAFVRNNCSIIEIPYNVASISNRAFAPLNDNYLEVILDWTSDDSRIRQIAYDAFELVNERPAIKPKSVIYRDGTPYEY